MIGQVYPKTFKFLFEAAIGLKQGFDLELASEISKLIEEFAVTVEENIKLKQQLNDKSKNNKDVPKFPHDFESYLNPIHLTKEEIQTAITVLSKVKLKDDQFAAIDDDDVLIAKLRDGGKDHYIVAKKLYEYITDNKKSDEFYL